MPHAYVDQGLASIPLLYPKHVLLAQRRSSEIGPVAYSLLVYKKDAAIDSVTIEGAAVLGPQAWTFTSACPSSVAMEGLAITLERIAGLAKRDAGDNWSAVVQGVRGRLIATPMRSSGRPQRRLELELENVSDLMNPIEIWWTRWGAMLDLSLEDEGGTVLPRLGMGGNEPSPPPFWFQLLHHSSMRATISERAYEYVAPDRVFLRPTPFQGWALASPGPSQLYLSAKFNAGASPPPRDRSWRGPLVLPRVRLR